MKVMQYKVEYFLSRNMSINSNNLGTVSFSHCNTSHNFEMKGTKSSKTTKRDISKIEENVNLSLKDSVNLQTRSLDRNDCGIVKDKISNDILKATDSADLGKNVNKLNLKKLRRNNSDKSDKSKSSNISGTNGISTSTSYVDVMRNDLEPLEDPPITDWEKKICSTRILFNFFDIPCEQLACSLLGKIMVRKLEDGTILKGKIVETESYLGIIDKASHSYQNRITPRNIPMYMPPGTIYVYMTYGMYHCFNISSRGEGCAVLIRALEPIQGIEQMMENRNLRSKSKKPQKVEKYFKPHELCNGPSKLCIALKLEKEHSKYSLCTWKGLWLENSIVEDDAKIIECARIGIDSAGPEWANKPLRFYIYGNKSVSKRDKKAENMQLQPN